MQNILEVFCIVHLDLHLGQQDTNYKSLKQLHMYINMYFKQNNHDKHMHPQQKLTKVFF